MSTPIAIIIFNRPDHATSLRASLQKEEERELFVISDGARKGRDDEFERVEECRRIFADWPGKLHINYAPENMGCKARVSSGLDWVFEQTERAIILEDDCLPHPDFFRYCDELLEYYADNEIVMSVCGTKSFPANNEEKHIFFSKYNNCWGWATWRRAWDVFSDTLSTYSSLELLFNLRKYLGSFRAALYWSYIIREVMSGKINSWAYCWSISCFLHQGLHIHPPENLIINGGFSQDSTHTQCRMDYIPVSFGERISFPLRKHENVESSPVMDQWIEDTIFSKSIKNRIKWLFQRFFPSC